MTTDVIPVLHVGDARASIEWYGRLGFHVSFEHRFAPELPLYVGLRREGAQLHLSEHAGDARPDTLVYVWVDDIEPIAAAFAMAIEVQPWAREVELIDPDGNRVRIAEPAGTSDTDDVLGEGTIETLRALETAMWEIATRGDSAWMDDHLTDDFVEHGRSGAVYDRASILDLEVDAIDVELPLSQLTVVPLGRDAALVTYRSVEPRGTANRASVWTRRDGRWRLSFHQGTPTG